MPREALIGRTFVELADTLVEGYDVIDFLHSLAERCVSLLDVAEAGVVLADVHGELRALASSSERMRLLELIELQQQDGPCLDCWREGAPVRADDLAEAAARWPRFVPAALDSGFLSVYAVPLRLRSDHIGALNLFADRKVGLSPDDEGLAQAMADVATIGILHERFLREHETLTAQLQTALNSRVALEQAKGIVAEQAGVDVDDAFGLLRGYARHHNRRLGEVVSDVIRHMLNSEQLLTRARGPATSRSDQ
jgi:transcriptional regulator with GAF, ATPase, and Fis domain